MAYTNLTDLFSAIADSIRSKTGSNGLIKADSFPDAIEAIETGGGGELALEEQIIIVDEGSNEIQLLLAGTPRFICLTKIDSLRTYNVASVFYCEYPYMNYMTASGRSAAAIGLSEASISIDGSSVTINTGDGTINFYGQYTILYGY